MRTQYKDRPSTSRLSYNQCKAEHEFGKPYLAWYVYFATQPHSGLVKIGASSRVPERIRAIASASGFHTELLACWEYSRRDAFKVESHLHMLFEPQRKLGEWFENIEIPSEPVQVERGIVLVDVRQAASA